MTARLPLALLLFAGCADPAPAPPACSVTFVAGLGLTPLHPWRTFEGGSALLADFVYTPALALSAHLDSATLIQEDQGDAVVLEVRASSFHDGSPVRPVDVAASIQAVNPASFRVEILDDRRLRVAFPGISREEALSRLDFIGVAPAWSSELDASWDPPPGSGPFRILSLGPTRSDLIEIASGMNLHILSVSGARAAWASALRDDADVIFDVPFGLKGFLPGWRAASDPGVKTYYAVISSRARGDGLEDVIVRSLEQSIPQGASRCAAGVGICDFLAPPPSRVLPRRSKRPVLVLYVGVDDRSSEASLRLARRLDQLGAESTLESVTVEEFIARRRSGDYDVIVSYSPQEGRQGGLRLLEAERADIGQVECAGAPLGSGDTALLAAWFVDRSTFGVREPLGLELPQGVPMGRGLAHWLAENGCAR